MESTRRQIATERALKKLIRQIVTFAAKSTEHIPPINFQASGPMTFCYEVCKLCNTTVVFWVVGNSVHLIPQLQIHAAKVAEPSWNWFSRLMKTEPPKFGV